MQKTSYHNSIDLPSNPVGIKFHNVKSGSRYSQETKLIFHLILADKSIYNLTIHLGSMAEYINGYGIIIDNNKEKFEEKINKKILYYKNNMECIQEPCDDINKEIAQYLHKSDIKKIVLDEYISDVYSLNKIHILRLMFGNIIIGFYNVHNGYYPASISLTNPSCETIKIYV